MTNLEGQKIGKKLSSVLASTWMASRSKNGSLLLAHHQ